MKTILKTQPNFRDLGQIPVVDGRKIKPGLLFRSGELFSLSDEDISTLEKIPLQMIIDLRAQREIDRRPDKPVKTIKSIVHIDIFDGARDRSEKFLKENNARELATVLIGDYRRMVVDHAPEFQKFLQILAATAHLPLVYHCAAGKDRTGLATIFLLTALGAEMEVIREDYLASNALSRIITDKIIREVTDSGQNGEILRPLLEVRDDYLDAALDEINKQYGSLENYVKNILLADRQTLQSKFLTR
ncbi:MAG: tyrosine-protein phosphatase [Bacteroidales bacterium]|nr:tyrosine-protein phosphatase [Bacteroidales bacterium]